MTRRTNSTLMAGFFRVVFPAKPWVQHPAIDRLEEMFVDEGKPVEVIAATIGKPLDYIVDALLIAGLEVGGYVRSDLTHSVEADLYERQIERITPVKRAVRA